MDFFCIYFAIRFQNFHFIQTKKKRFPYRIFWKTTLLFCKITGKFAVYLHEICCSTYKIAVPQSKGKNHFPLTSFGVVMIHIQIKVYSPRIHNKLYHYLFYKFYFNSKICRQFIPNIVPVLLYIRPSSSNQRKC